MTWLPDLDNRERLHPDTAQEMDRLIPKIQKYTMNQPGLKELQDYVPWTDVPYAAGNFLQSTGTWTVDQADVTVFKYMVLMKTMFLQFSCFNTTTNGVTNTCRVVVPGGYRGRVVSNLVPFIGVFIWSNSGGTATKDLATSDNPKAAMGAAFLGGNGTFISLVRNDPTTSVGAGYANGVNTYNFAFNLTIELADT